MHGRCRTAWIALFCALVVIILPYSTGILCCINDECEPPHVCEERFNMCVWKPKENFPEKKSYFCSQHPDVKDYPVSCRGSIEKECRCSTDRCNNKFHTASSTQAPAPAPPPGPPSAPDPPPPPTKSASANLTMPNEVLAAAVIFLFKFRFVN